MSECSLDHDLGLHLADPDLPDADMQAGWDQENDGLQLVEWMVEHKIVPDKVTIHSWNYDGAARMSSYLAQAMMFEVIPNRPDIIVKPYLPKGKQAF